MEYSSEVASTKGYSSEGENARSLEGEAVVFSTVVGGESGVMT